ncbi:hypothetical protein P8452_32072 [Trifolium repens]|nr:hypothetical protein P8452_32072 [Trifolium repens]
MAKPSTTENPPVIIPWSYLSQTSKPTPPPKPSPPSPPTQQKTFDQALSNFVDHNIENCKRRKDGIIKEATKKPVTVKQFVPVQNKGKVDEVINVEGSASKEYTQVRHDQERLEADKLLEIELNKNLGDTEACSNSPHNSENVEDVVPVHIITPGVDTQDNSSSIGSDFVDNTQIGQDPKHISSKSDGAEQIPLLVQNDIQFLKESWANLAILKIRMIYPPWLQFNI